VELNERPVGDTGQAVIVELSGPVGRDSGAAGVLLTRLKGLIAHGYKTILLNVAQVTYKDSLKEIPLRGSPPPPLPLLYRSGGEPRR